MSRSCLVFHHVIDNVWLGNIHAIDQDVDVIVNASNSRYDLKQGIIYHHIDVPDRRNANIAPYFDLVYDVVSGASAQDKRVLVHCLGGVSRSVSLVLAVLVRKGVTLREGLALLNDKRDASEMPAQPNSGFFKQLIEYETKWLGEPSMTLQEYLDA